MKKKLWDLIMEKQADLLAGKDYGKTTLKELEALAENAGIDANTPDNLDSDELIDEALIAFGIDEKYVLASRIDEEGRAVIVTNGGKKVRYAAGDKVEPLDAIAITGINPAAAKRKVIAGKAK